MIGFFWLLAQASASQPAGATPAPPNPINLVIALAAAMVLFFWWTSRTQKREQQKFQQMLANLKKNDRVQTIGGLLATVVEVRDGEVVLKVDETNNVRVRVVLGAIKEVIQESPRSEPADAASRPKDKK